MYQSFEVRNFRGFSRLNIEDIERVNLIAGKNDSGKTTLLEALFIHSGAYNPRLVMNINAFRGIQTLKLEFGPWAETPWDSVFNEFDLTKKVKIIGSDKTAGSRILQLKVVRTAKEMARIRDYIDYIDYTTLPQAEKGAEQEVKLESVYLTPGTTHVLELQCIEGKRQRNYYLLFDAVKGARITPIPPPPPYRTIILPSRVRLPRLEDPERFGKLEILKTHDVVLNVLKIVEPRLQRLTVIGVGGVPIMYADVGKERLIQLALLGEGVVRLASLISAIGSARNGVVLVDEIENGLHHSILLKVWKAIGEAARQFNTQVFATTHSFECIVAAHEAFLKEKSYDFRLHRLERTKGAIHSVTYDRETLSAAIETGLEVR